MSHQKRSILELLYSTEIVALNNVGFLLYASIQARHMHDLRFK